MSDGTWQAFLGSSGVGSAIVKPCGIEGTYGRGGKELQVGHDDELPEPRAGTNSPISPLHLPYISSTSPLHLPYTSPTPRLHPRSISVLSPLYLACRCDLASRRCRGHGGGRGDAGGGAPVRPMHWRRRSHHRPGRGATRGALPVAEVTKAHEMAAGRRQGWVLVQMRESLQ